jgi:monoamine oxidase
MAAMRGVGVIEGGSDRLPGAMAAALGDRVVLDAPVVAISQTAGGVSATYLEGSARRTVAADYLICTIPFPVLRSIEVEPPFSPAKRRAIEGLPATSVTRVFVQTRDRFWQDAGLPAGASTDLPVDVCADVAQYLAGPAGIMESYQAGPSARRTAALPEEARLAATVEALDLLYPGMSSSYTGGRSYAWDDDPWARGGYAWSPPGAVTELEPAAATPEGRVYFAGDHASPWPGWMQGALWSGLRAASAIQEAQANAG